MQSRSFFQEDSETFLAPVIQTQSDENSREDPAWGKAAWKHTSEFWYIFLALTSFQIFHTQPSCIATTSRLPKQYILELPEEKIESILEHAIYKFIQSKNYSLFPWVLPSLIFARDGYLTDSVVVPFHQTDTPIKIPFLH
jgi:hypothetical protein